MRQVGAGCWTGQRPFTFGFKGVDAGRHCSHFGLLQQSTHKLGSLNGFILSTGGQEVQDSGADRVKQGPVVSSSCDN